MAIPIQRSAIKIKKGDTWVNMPAVTKSAYQSAIDAGFVGTEQEFIETIITAANNSQELSNAIGDISAAIDEILKKVDEVNKR